MLSFFFNKKKGDHGEQGIPGIVGPRVSTTTLVYFQQLAVMSCKIQQCCFYYSLQGKKGLTGEKGDKVGDVASIIHSCHTRIGLSSPTNAFVSFRVNEA